MEFFYHAKVLMTQQSRTCASQNHKNETCSLSFFMMWFSAWSKFSPGLKFSSQPVFKEGGFPGWVQKVANKL